MNLVDTSGWIEYFFKEANADSFALPIEDTVNLIVPTICLYEVFKKINLAGNEAQALTAIAHMKQGTIVPLTEAISLSASLISIKHKLGMADSLIYATAQAYKAKMWTQDADFKDLVNVKYIYKN